MPVIRNAIPVPLYVEGVDYWSFSDCSPSSQSTSDSSSQSSKAATASQSGTPFSSSNEAEREGKQQPSSQHLASSILQRKETPTLDKASQLDMEIINSNPPITLDRALDMFIKDGARADPSPSTTNHCVNPTELSIQTVDRSKEHDIRIERIERSLELMRLVLNETLENL